MQWTLEQHVFELCGSTHVQIFFNIQYYTICGWLNPWIQNHRYGGLRVGLEHLLVLVPLVVQGSTVSVTIILQN